jgi:hypothetical protein
MKQPPPRRPNLVILRDSMDRIRVREFELF